MGGINVTIHGLSDAALAFRGETHANTPEIVSTTSLAQMHDAHDAVCGWHALCRKKSSAGPGPARCVCDVLVSDGMTVLRGEREREEGGRPRFSGRAMQK